MNSVSSFYRAVLLILLAALISPGGYAQNCNIIGASEGCMPHTVQLSATASGGQAITSYLWDLAGVSSTSANPQRLFTTPGLKNISLEITLADGTKQFCNTTVTVFDLPKAVINLPNPSTQCFQGNNFQFSHSSQRSADNFPLVSFLWNFGDGQTSTSQNPSHSYQANGKYNITLTVTDSKGCTHSETKTLGIEVLPDIVPRFTTNGAVSCDSSAYTFNNQTDTNGIFLTSFTWDFDDGTTVTANVGDPDFNAKWTGFKHTYTAGGEFFPKLTITNKLGCKGSFTPANPLENIVPKIDLFFIDTVCYSGNNVRFVITPIPGAEYTIYNFGDPDAGNLNIAEYQYIASHEFVGGPKNYTVTFQAFIPKCNKFIDTCFIVHLMGPQAAIFTPPPPAFPPFNFVKNRKMPRQVLEDINNAVKGKASFPNGSPTGLDSNNLCLLDEIAYSYYVKTNIVNTSINTYCNAPVTYNMDTIGYCDGDTQVFPAGANVTPTGSRNISYLDSSEVTVLFKRGDPLPSASLQLYYPSSGTVNMQTMHDSDQYVGLYNQWTNACTYPGNLVRFTNNSKKYRLYNALDDIPFGGGNQSLLDTCKYPSYPFASDSMLYLWKFNDRGPDSKPCTSSINNRDWDCNFSTLAAPYHYYRDPTPPPSRCQNVNLMVTDPVTGCADSMILNLRHGAPDAGWDPFYCKINWDIQKILPSNPRRGFRMSQQNLNCASPNYRFRIDLSEVLPSCGVQKYWVTFDSAASTTAVCNYTHPVTGVKTNYLDHGFLGSTNSQGWPVGAPDDTWNNLPFLGFYWYLEGDEGCKTIGVVVQNGECFDTAWYNDYICFNRLDPEFKVFGKKVEGLSNEVLIGESDDAGFGKACMLDEKGIKLRMIPKDLDQDLVTKWFYWAERREFPGGDYYYNKPFWPDSAVAKPFTLAFDSINSYKDTAYIPIDSSLYTIFYGPAGNIIDSLGVNGLYLTKQEINKLMVQDTIMIPIKEEGGYRARKLDFYCDRDYIALGIYPSRQPFTINDIKDTVRIINFRDTLFGSRDTAIVNMGNGVFDTIIKHDTIEVVIPYPGFYTVTSAATNIDGCNVFSNYHIIVGHFARFHIKGGDSIICAGTKVDFEHKIRYWMTDCQPPLGGPPPDGCLDECITPWDNDAVAVRQACIPGGWTAPGGFVREELWFDYDGNGTWDQKINPGTVPSFTYTDPGIYTVRMLSVESSLTGRCSVITTRRDFVKVIGVNAGFVLSPENDTLKVCAPQNFVYRDTTRLLGGDTSVNMPGKFAHRTKVIVPGPLVDTTIFAGPFSYTGKIRRNIVIDTIIIIDSIDQWNWTPGDGRPTITRTQTDTVDFVYTENGTYDVSLKIRTANGCTDSLIKPDYITILGPKPNFDISGDTAGCIPFALKVNNYNSAGFFYEWEKNDGTTENSNTGQQDVTLTYNKPGTYKLFVYMQEAVLNPLTGKIDTCLAIWPDSTNPAHPVFNVVVYGPDSTLISGPDTTCPNKSVTYSVTPKQAGTTVAWDMGNGQTGSGSTFTTSYAQEGTYTIRVTSTTVNKCVFTDSFTVFVDPVIAEFDVDSALGNIGQYSFINRSKGGVRHVWHFDFINNGDTLVKLDTTSVSYNYAQSLTPNFEAVPGMQSSTFKVCLVVRNSEGCEDSVCKDVTFTREWQPYNVFTPDGDGFNDTFDPKIEGETMYDLEIYNRWGERVFKSENKNDDWNGKVNNTGADCAAGTYYYIWKFKIIGANETLKQGTVTIIR